MNKLRKILSINGGGIRGIIPCVVLSFIEEITQKPIYELFDIIGGCSTGGIIALGLTVKNNKYKASDLQRLYDDYGKIIFSSSIIRNILNPGTLDKSKYDNKNLKKVLIKFFEKNLLQDTITKVVINSYDFERNIPVYFKSYDKQVEYKLVDVALATSAAPTFFPPVRINNKNDYFGCIDGGIYCNNPSLLLYSEAKKLWPNDDFLLVSLGTGELTRRHLYNDVKNWGLLSWGKELFNMSINGTSKMVNDVLKNILPHDKFYSYEIRLDIGSDDMDDASFDNRRKLQLLGEEITRRDYNKLKNMCNLLK